MAEVIKVLQDFYGEAAKATALLQKKKQPADAPEIFGDEAYTGMQSASGGVLGMMEVINSDFVRLESDTKAAEAAAAAEYDKFMEEMGVNVMKRKLAEHDNLKITIEQTGDKFHLKESSTFRTKDIDFTLGVQFDYALADGTEVSGAWEMDGDMLNGKFTRKDNNKVLTTTRSLVGGELVQTYNYEGVDAKRIFKKQ